MGPILCQFFKTIYNMSEMQCENIATHDVETPVSIIRNLCETHANMCVVMFFNLAKDSKSIKKGEHVD